MTFFLVNLLHSIHVLTIKDGILHREMQLKLMCLGKYRIIILSLTLQKFLGNKSETKFSDTRNRDVMKEHLILFVNKYKSYMFLMS